ncbi:MAG: hypothetical protein KAU14_07965 [Thermoplasmata archaeon]|nr:hypothetical protein [Thermoplasmata archaeon]
MKPTHIILFALLFFLAGTLVFVLTTPQSTSAETITVDDDGPANHSRIQYAIDNGVEGDTILVKEGTYYENVIVNKMVNLEGAGADKTTINGSESGIVVKIEADGPSDYLGSVIIQHHKLNNP